MSNPHRYPHADVARPGRLRRAGWIATAIGFFLIINALTAVGAQYITSAGGIAWEAHLGGFFFGLLAFALFAPPAPRLERPMQEEETIPPTLH